LDTFVEETSSRPTHRISQHMTHIAASTATNRIRTNLTAAEDLEVASTAYYSS